MIPPTFLHQRAASHLYYKIQGIAQVNLPRITGLETVDNLGIELMDDEATEDGEK